ncbi:hypothetical protein Ddc_21845 [Ditylenchus destructor]|nr:hypothetical protein Ddc_21845 [Ditylenchus destructor]
MVALDNDTMVETLKYLNYMQLAKSSLVAKRFSNLIRTHRHSLALLDVDGIEMSENNQNAACIKIFNKVFSPKAYNEWIIRNRYSKQIPLKDQVAENQSEQYGRQVYEMKADYKDSNKTTWVFVARAELSHENWPLFQHFVRLLTDPFIYIRRLKLTPRIDVLFINLLGEAMNPDYDRLQCDAVSLISNSIDLDVPNFNVPNFTGWIKDHVLCNEFRIWKQDDSDYDVEMLDLFVTGANCTSAISITHGDLSNVIMALLQKFMSLKSRDEYQLVESISGNVESRGIVEKLKRKYAEFIADEEQLEDNFGTKQVIGFINNDIEKKLTLSVKIENESYVSTWFSIKILARFARYARGKPHISANSRPSAARMR